MTKTTNSDETARVHPFEAAGLGTAPFRMVGSHTSMYQACPGAPIQPGTCCDYCATGISNVFVIRGADGREFKVGCECVRKTGSKGDKVLDDVEREVRRLNREKRHAREKAKIEKGMAMLDENRERLQQIPHPMEWAAEKGLTFADYADWYLKNAGNAGKLGMLKSVAKRLEES